MKTLTDTTPRRFHTSTFIKAMESITSPRRRARRRRALCLEKTRLLGECIELALPLNQLRGRVELDDLSLVQHHDPITVHDGVDAMRDGDDGAVLENTAA